MTALTIQQLKVFGPDRCDTLTIEQARSMCRRLAHGRYENFSVLSAVVPRALRDDFAALYAFCRWADDLGDEVGDPQRSLELLAWWRRELQQCFDGQPRHPVMLALRPVIEAHGLPIEPFDDLIKAFEQDQRVDRYATWDQLLDYCRLSANPVGRLVLMICGERREPDLFNRADAACTALQLTNHWQDVKRDVLERNRIYIPQEMIDEPLRGDFEARLIASARQGWGVDQRFLDEFRGVLKDCVDRTWPLFGRGASVLDVAGHRTRPIVWLLMAGGQHVLRQIELWNHETALHRPRLGKAARAMLVAKAWWLARGASGVHGGPTNAAGKEAAA
jgi:squalene synthase HpnC